MNIKYIGMDVHKEAISIAVMNGEGKLVMESIIETIQLLLGHRDLEETTIYLHLSSKHLCATASPLDALSLNGSGGRTPQA